MVAATLGCHAVEQVRVYEGKKTILTGPFRLKGPAPQERLGEFKPTDYPAVYIENEYLRCCVLPTVGGRLYEVYNKASKSQLFFANPYLDAHPDDFEGGHPWNLGGVEVNFPYFHHGNTYNDRWTWAPIRRGDGTVGVAMGFTSRPTMQRTVFRVLLRPGVARVDLEYLFENMNPYSWGLAAWIDTMHPKTMETQFILPSPWVAQHGYNAHRTDLKPWPIRDGVDISWQKNIPPKGDLSEFAFMPRVGFHGCYEHGADRGAVRIFDPKTLPAAKLWTQAPPVTPQQYYQHFEIWTATSAVMEDPGIQPELASYAAADSWYQAWGIGGYVFANRDVALNLARRPDGKLLAGICGTRKIPNCVATLREGHATFHRETFDLDPAKPWRRELAGPPGDVTLEVLAPDGTSVASYELCERELPREDWVMPKKPRWQGGVNNACYDEAYSTLWRRRGHFLDGAINRFLALLKENPKSVELMLDLARAYLKDEQVRLGSWYPNPGPEADADAAKRRASDVESAVALLRSVLEAEPQNATAHFYLGLALERQGKLAEATDSYRAALKCPAPALAAGLCLARRIVKDSPSEAAALARRTAEAYPQSVRAKQMLMVALAAAGKPAEAAATGEKLREADPCDPVVASLLESALRSGSKPAEARSYADEVQRLCANDPGTLKRVSEDIRWLRGEP
jgi:tetratricopeptide (TPR) repeat protein